MIADLGTRKGACIADISSSSSWINSLEWMKGDKRDFPVKSVNDLKLRTEDLESVKVESLRPECIESLVDLEREEESILEDDYHFSYIYRTVDSKVLQERYVFSEYIIDPNRFRLRKVVRVLALVMLFIRKLISRVRHQQNEVLINEVSVTVPAELSKGQYIVTTGN